MDIKDKRLSILSHVQAIAAGVVSVVVFSFYTINTQLLKSIGLTAANAIIGVVILIYYGTIHQLVKKHFPGPSTLVITALSAANLLLVIATTGGLDSPYYSLWLLVIVASGIFGLIYTLISLLLTVAFHIYGFAGHNYESSYIFAHLGQLLISLGAGALAEWVHYSLRRATQAKKQLASLTGEVSAEQQKAQVAMNSVAEGVIVVNKDRQIELFNRAAQELTGWDEQSALSLKYQSVLNLRTAVDKALTEQDDPFTQSWTAGKSVVRRDLVMLTRDNERAPISLSVSPIYDATGVISGGIALFRDITDEKEIERQRTEFISTASHEMRTPVSAIEGYIALARNPQTATVDARAKEYLDKAHQSIEHLGALFKDLLEATQMEDKNSTETLEQVDLAHLVEEAVGDMQFTAQERRLKLELDTGSVKGKKDILPQYLVLANTERLREVISNLIDNAIKFTPQGGVTVALKGDDISVTVSVADTGAGIPADDIPHLFQKFYRVDQSSTRSIGGTGLGLYLCRGIIEGYSGKIWAESIPGKGATFSFTLPRIKNPSAIQPSKHIAAVKA